MTIPRKRTIGERVLWLAGYILAAGASAAAFGFAAHVAIRLIAWGWRHG